MKAILFFCQTQLVIIDGQIFVYDTNLLDKLIRCDEIFVVTYPGSYTGIRKAIAITKAIGIIYPIKFYGINLLRDFGALFYEKVFLFDGKYIHTFDKKSQQISLEIDLVNFLDKNDFVGNVTNKNRLELDFSIENIFKNLERIPKMNIQQEYYDKFSM